VPVLNSSSLVVGDGSELPAETVVLSLLLGLSAIGTSIVNDFKSVKGDTQMGLSSIPVMYGESGAKWTTVLMTNVPQIMAAVYLALERDQPVSTPALVTYRAMKLWVLDFFEF
jgi:4-hydroxybenzoate polyprenyltransferase